MRDVAFMFAFDCLMLLTAFVLTGDLIPLLGAVLFWKLMFNLIKSELMHRELIAEQDTMLRG